MGVTVPQIHSTAIVDPRAELAEDVVIGPYTIIDGPVRIGPRTHVHSHSVIEGLTTIGADNKIFPFTSIGVVPQDLKFAGETTETIIGDRNTIRESVTIHRGTAESMRTVVGNDCLLMAMTHVAHDCVVGDHVIMANVAALAGHVVVEDWAIIGGLVAVVQFVTVGAHCYIGAGGIITKDVPPFMLVFSNPEPRVGTINLVGLKRRGFDKDRLSALKQAYRLLYRSGLNNSQAVERIRGEVEQTEDIRQLLRFIKNSTVGIIKGGTDR